MSLQFATSTRNAILDAMETDWGTAVILRIYTGSAPANCAASVTGTKVADMTLPTDYLANAASGVKSLSGTWTDSSADATGTAGYFRIYKSDGTTCVCQGLCGTSGSDLNLTTTSIVSGQPVTVTQFDLTAPGA